MDSEGELYPGPYKKQQLRIAAERIIDEFGDTQKRQLSSKQIKELLDAAFNFMGVNDRHATLEEVEDLIEFVDLNANHTVEQSELVTIFERVTNCISEQSSSISILDSYNSQISSKLGNNLD